MNQSSKKYLIRLSILVCLVIFVAGYLSKKNSKPFPQWDWKNINLDDTTFPKNFLWGACVTEYQVSGAHRCPDSNWAHFEQQQQLKERSGIACNHWNLYKHDVTLLKDLGVKALRFSTDWSVIEPQEGQFNQEALEHYLQLCDELLAANIQPVITLHHFIHPLWFEQKGGFEKEENIQYFIRFSERIFTALNGKVALWCTINEPTMVALESYLMGVSPPGKFLAFNRALTVLKNLLLSHVAVYNTLKSLPGGQEAKIGIVHATPRFKPYHDWNFFCAYVASQLNAFVVDSVLNFFKTGTFKVSLLGGLFSAYHECPEAKNTNDFIGLNYYSRILVGITGSACLPDDIKTDMPYAVYAEGLYDAIKDVAALKVPIYITENGVADANDTLRDLWLKRYLFVLSKAINDGYDVRGYFYWALMDGYEWSFGYNQKFGLYQVDFATQERSLRKGAEYFIAMAKANTVTASPPQG